MTDLEELKKLAEAATPGPWDYDTHDTPFRVVNGEVVGGDCTGIGEVYTGYDVPDHSDDGMPEPHTIASDVSLRDGRFIRAANPQTVLELVIKIKQLQDENADLRAKCNHIMQQHAERIDECGRLQEELEEARRKLSKWRDYSGCQS